MIDDRDHGHDAALADTATATIAEPMPANLPAEVRAPSLVQRFAQRYAVDPEKLLVTLKATCFKSDKPATNEQMMGLLIVAEQYRLNPFTREIFAFADKSGGLIPYVSVDGWARIINERPEFDGVEFNMERDPLAITATIFRKDRTHPTRVTEYMSECRRTSIPWQTTPLRMLRHRALIQCARLAFGFAGIYDEDEARHIRDMGVAERVDRETRERPAPETIETAPAAIEEAKRLMRERASRRKGPTLSYAELVDQLKRCTTTGSASAVLALAAHLPDDQQAELREVAASLDLAHDLPAGEPEPNP